MLEKQRCGAGRFPRLQTLPIHRTQQSAGVWSDPSSEPTSSSGTGDCTEADCGQREPRERRGVGNACASRKAGLAARDPRGPVFAASEPSAICEEQHFDPGPRGAWSGLLPALMPGCAAPIHRGHPTRRSQPAAGLLLLLGRDPERHCQSGLPGGDKREACLGGTLLRLDQTTGGELRLTVTRVSPRATGVMTRLALRS